MFSYYEGGIKFTNDDTLVITFDLLQSNIKSHPKIEDIEQLRAIEYGSKAYKEFKVKSNFPCIKPHGTFKSIVVKGDDGKNHITYELIKLSGYLYFDIDANKINSDVNAYKDFLQSEYYEYISMLGKSIGGKGVFFLIKVDGLTAENFNDTYEYYRTIVFKDLDIDNNAKGLTRSFFIPSDEKLYVNKHITLSAVIPTNLQKVNYSKQIDKKGAGQCIIKRPAEAYTLNCTFLPIKDIFPKIVWCTPVEVIHPIVDIKPVVFLKVFVHRIIVDGDKHTSFRGIVHALLYLNPWLSLEEMLSVLSWINRRYTIGTPLTNKRLIDVVSDSYNSAKTLGPQVRTKIRWIHFNKSYGLSGDMKRLLANKLRSFVCRYKNVLKIKHAREWLIENHMKPTQTNVCEKLAEEKLTKTGMRNIKKYWKEAKSDVETNLITDECLYELVESCLATDYKRICIKPVVEEPVQYIQSIEEIEVIDTPTKHLINDKNNIIMIDEEEDVPSFIKLLKKEYEESKKVKASLRWREYKHNYSFGYAEREVREKFAELKKEFNLPLDWN